MKGLFLIALLIIMTSSGYANTPESETSLSQATTMAEPFDWVPWPLGKELPFPWNAIQGVWKTYETETPSLLILKPFQNRKGNGHQLQIRHIDAKTCKTIAAGLAIESDRVVTGQMTGPNGLVYRISLRAFSEEDARRDSLDRLDKLNDVMAASFMLLKDPSAKIYHSQIIRLSESLKVQNCNQYK